MAAWGLAGTMRGSDRPLLTKTSHGPTASAALPDLQGMAGEGRGGDVYNTVLSSSRSCPQELLLPGAEWGRAGARRRPWRPAGADGRGGRVQGGAGGGRVWRAGAGREVPGAGQATRRPSTLLMQGLATL